jgi:hypothetical protein
MHHSPLASLIVARLSEVEDGHGYLAEDQVALCLGSGGELVARQI